MNMEYRFSDRIASVAPSAIREILKVTQDPSVISFAAGNPAPESFPAKEMNLIASEIFETKAAEALQYGISEGYLPLRNLLKQRLKDRYGIGRDFDDTVVVSGGQQGIEMTAKVILNEGDTLICEEPSFIGALNAFKSYGAVLKSARVEEDGIDLDALEEILKSDPRARLIYVIPTFQNPSGRVMSLAKRRALLELADRYDVMILEDNPYYDLRYEGEPVPTLKSMDDKGRVIYVGSFSKVLSPGIRVGYVTAPSWFLSKLIVAKQVSDVHSNLLFQIVIAEYLQRYDLDGHIRSICRLNVEKRDRMLSGLEASCRSFMKIERPEGGLFIWATLPEGYDGAELCKIAAGFKVAAVPGVAFLVDDTVRYPALRFNFSLPSLEQIDLGCELFGRACALYQSKGGERV